MKTLKNLEFSFLSHLFLLFLGRKLMKQQLFHNFESKKYKSIIPSIEVTRPVLDFQIILELLELHDKPLIGPYTRSLHAKKQKTVLEGVMVFVHQISAEESGGSRNTCCTVHQHIPLFSLILDEANGREGGVTHLFVFAVPQIQPVNRDTGIIGDGEVYCSHQMQAISIPDHCTAATIAFILFSFNTGPFWEKLSPLSHTSPSLPSAQRIFCPWQKNCGILIYVINSLIYFLTLQKARKIRAFTDLLFQMSVYILSESLET